jgi:4-hydroxythreonine-4-phosphate dehydrogenase
VSPLYITVGDPDGIGPEVVVRALLSRARGGRPLDAVVVGDRAAIDAAVARWSPFASLRIVEPEGDEPVEVRAIRFAVERVRAGEGCALVTGPIHKAKLAASGFAFTGHTDFLGSLLGVSRPVMAFVGGSVRVALVTTHLPLSQVPAAVTQDAVEHAIATSHAALVEQLGLAAPRIAVCGLNPHAGDNGLLGHEDAEQIAPAVETARASGMRVEGPISAEAAFVRARRGLVDLVVAMYHDQGLAPLKALDFGRSVNWTLGLPIVRTSVDHGTAYDIAGKGIADPSSMLAAVGLAEKLSA